MVAPLHHQLVVYASDPHRLARFYAEAMGYLVEDNDAFVESLLAAGAVEEGETRVIDGRRFFAEAVAIRHPDDPVDPQRGSGRGRRILFELQKTEKADENRLHIDLNVGRDRLDEETARIIGLGATLLYERRNWPPGEFNRLADPEGNEFCVQ
jgi:predicted enzyme related to lactoylglutathione lyase